MRTEVHKFGGTSVGDGDRIGRCADLLVAAAGAARIVAVASAMGSTTDDLLQAAEAASQGDLDRAVDATQAIRTRHEDALRDLGGVEAIGTSEAVRVLCAGLEMRLRGIAALGELSPRARDGIVAVGEKLSIRLLAHAVRQRGSDAEALDADSFLETDSNFGSATPLPGVADREIVHALSPHLESGRIPVVTGFCGQGPDGGTTTLGRGGSDYSATLLAAALDADEVVIWTDVDGVYTADPGIVPEARPIPHLNYREAGELSYYGARVLHQRTIIPVAGKGIPVRIRSTLDPKTAGTVIDGRFTRGSHPVKAVSAIVGQALVSIEGKGMAGVPGIAKRVFGALALADISVTMISQSSSESSICLAVPETQATEAEVALKRAFRSDLSSGDVEEIIVQRHIALLAAVGLGMAHTTGVAARVCGALAERRTNILAVAQGSSELNISLAVERRDADDAVRAIHHAFGLHRLDTGEDTTRRLDLLVFGFGAIGRELVRLVLERSGHVRNRFGLEVRIVAVCDRSGYLLAPRGLSPDALQAAAVAKTDGHPLASRPGAVADASPSSMLAAATRFRLARPILIDTSDAADADQLFVEAFGHRVDVVTANKKPLAGPIAVWRDLGRAASAAGRRLKAEATVGAGLPVVDTVETLRATGDVIRSVEGCLSGTLAFVCGELEVGRPLSEVVREAIDRGYTEPDPTIDLLGVDVVRKALILGRMSGLLDGDAPAQSDGLVPRELTCSGADALLARLATYDETMAQRITAARAAGRVLRYVARIETGRIDVGPREVDADSNLGRLEGTDNMLIFTTDRYSARPLVVTGPGAGIGVTAMAVLGDVLRIAAERAGIPEGVA